MPPTDNPSDPTQPQSRTAAASTTQKPTVGRIVQFRNGDQVEAALIVAVHADNVVNLVVWNAGGTQRVVASAELGPGAGQWNWPTRI